MPRTLFLADVPISLYRQAPEDLPEGQGVPSLEERLLANDYAHRRDRRVTETDLAGLQTYQNQRQYIVRKDAAYTVDVDPALGAGYGLAGSNPAGGAAPNAPVVAKRGSNAAPGLLLRDDETGEFFNVTGVTLMPDNKRQVIHCGAVTGGS